MFPDIAQCSLGGTIYPESRTTGLDQTRSKPSTEQGSLSLPLSLTTFLLSSPPRAALSSLSLIPSSQLQPCLAWTAAAALVLTGLLYPSSTIPELDSTHLKNVCSVLKCFGLSHFHRMKRKSFAICPALRAHAPVKTPCPHSPLRPPGSSNSALLSSFGWAVMRPAQGLCTCRSSA